MTMVKFFPIQMMKKQNVDIFNTTQVLGDCHYRIDFSSPFFVPITMDVDNVVVGMKFGSSRFV
jgi:hypothetical protein